MIEKIKEILANQLDVEIEEITAESDIQKDLKADSLDVMDIVAEIEDEFDIEIDDEEIEKFVTPQDIVDYIEKVK
ncbi:MAG: acyl carrier protein [Eubacteriales bacterium]|nr:acyl carrier protein [Eubacteriales bacterium]MDY3332418.1 acyl carrier protein [Gallibacter sp.]